MNDGKYEKKIRLAQDEVAAKINTRTGEVVQEREYKNNLPEDKVVFNPEGRYRKMYDIAWSYLLDTMKPVELGIIVRMTQMTRMNSNSLAPLSDTTTSLELSETFGVHRNYVKNTFKKLLKHGVYADFKFGDGNQIKHYWVLNPYISFKGKTMSKALQDLFRESPIAKLTCI